jgi:hypothetical protein
VRGFENNATRQDISLDLVIFERSAPYYLNYSLKDYCKTPHLHNSTTPQLHIFTTPQLHNSTTSQLHNSTTSQLHNSTNSQLHNFTTPQLWMIKNNHDSLWIKKLP